MPKNIDFGIIECSGEDVENPCMELLAHSQESAGWSTPRNAAYPQQVTLRLERCARLQQIQLLSHEYKIAGKVELLVAPPAHPTDFTRLGFLSFDPNARTNFSARELKSVTLSDVEAAAVRLVIHRCHPNELNAYSQANLIMLNIVGEPLRDAAGNTTTAAAELPAPHARLSGAVALNGSSSSTPYLEVGVDQVTAERIRELNAQKAAAVAVEDYDEAKRLKGAVDRLRAAGVKMSALEARKKAAVEVEDYDTAKAIKHELERMRHRAYAGVLRGEGSPLPSPQRVSHTHDGSQRSSMQAPPPMPPPQWVGQQHPLQSSSHSPEHSTAEAGAANNELAPRVERLSFNNAAGGSPSNSHASGASPSPAAAPRRVSQNPLLLSVDSEYDERPARAKGAYDLANIEKLDAATPPPGAPPPPPLRRVDANAGAGADTPPACPGFPSDLPAPEPLLGEDAAEAAPLAELVGEFLARCVYSKSWQLREAGVAAITAAVLRFDGLPGLEADADALRALCLVVAKGLKERIPAGVVAALSLLRAVVSAAPSRRISPHSLQSALGELLPTVAERAADGAPRTKEQAIETLLAIAGVKEAGLGQLTPALLRPFKRGEAPKAMLGRLQLVAALLPPLGVAAGGHGGDGFAAEEVMRFVAAALTSANAEVRAAAVEVTGKVGAAAGPAAVLPLLPGDLNPKLKEQLVETLTGRKPVPAKSASASKGGPEQQHKRTTDPPVSAAAARARKGTPARPGTRGNERSGSAAAATAATLPFNAQHEAPRGRQPSVQRKLTNGKAPMHSPSHAAKQRQEQPSRQPNPLPHYPLSADAAAAAPPPAIPAYRPQEPEYVGSYAAEPTAAAGVSAWPSYAPAVAGPEFSVLEEDPAPFEAELRRREAALGPSHPAVAEAASNLAIIYNQRGDPAAALPLYQHALRVWEATHGPEHPDVAHALTDIAVILLEGGRDAEGKRLLRRALDIQLRLLGPSHPDVIAIRDVLEEEA